MTTTTPLLPGGLPFSIDEALALRLDAAEALSPFRLEFDIPTAPEGTPLVYLMGNSLGLMPKAARAELLAVADAWSRFGVEGWWAAPAPWVSYQDALRGSLASLTGARTDEVVTMNTLTVNLHLMLATFYRPKARRFKVLMEAKPFPSDRYAVASHLRLRRIDPDDAILLAEPRAGESVIRTGDFEALISDRGREIALVLVGGVNYYSGQWFDLPRLAGAARRAGAIFGVDLAHAIGNVPLDLHGWDVDFGIWCSYKYLNGGPGAIGGAFVHGRHGRDVSLPRLAGWWGHAPATRFAMAPDFEPADGAAGWQVSSPPVLSMAPLRPALHLFDRATMAALRRKSVALTGYLEALLHARTASLPSRTGPGAGSSSSPRLRMLTPADPEARGCQLSLHLAGEGRRLHAALRARGIVTDYREPDVVRLAPVPLYNTFHDVWRAADAIASVLADEEVMS